ncbi:aldo/keto reductase family protein [Rhizoctonia solani]|uniref:Aldo/keto reductase family protein n=1 Tax=Rhizoctonia solani TaxID=456999 RepID=A0A8H8NZ86_9AGAM|nr:aldo/keto reductase family protein [Rhizoctonia solani]QRW21023.1 aldo/keto reductase family protein [Rhizoctonia solani]
MPFTSSAKKMTYGGYFRLGNSALKVSRFILGLGGVGSKSWQPWAIEEEETIQLIKAAYDAGIQTFDTSNNYSGGDSERILGKAVKQLNLPRDEIVVMTKFTPKLYFVAIQDTSIYPGPAADAAGYVNQYGLSRKHIFESIKHSLERLQLDYVDVLQCHRFDYDTPIAETMEALHNVVKAGYACYIGMSSCHAYQFHAMQNYAINNKLTPFISMQSQYNLIYRKQEREMIPTLKMFGVGMIPWSPLSQGVLSRPYSQTSLRDKTSFLAAIANQAKEGNKEIVLCLEKMANTQGISMAQVAMAWHLSKDTVTAPIIGAMNLGSLEDTIGAIDVKLTDKEIRHLEEPYIAQAIQGYV